MYLNTDLVTDCDGFIIWRLYIAQFKYCTGALGTVIPVHYGRVEM
jgi:hypothetical protein